MPYVPPNARKGATLRILFESSPQFGRLLGATDRAAITRRDCIEFAWVRE